MSLERGSGIGVSTHLIWFQLPPVDVYVATDGVGRGIDGRDNDDRRPHCGLNV